MEKTEIYKKKNFTFKFFCIVILLNINHYKYFVTNVTVICLQYLELIRCLFSSKWFFVFKNDFFLDANSLVNLMFFNLSVNSCMEKFWRQFLKLRVLLFYIFYIIKFSSDPKFCTQGFWKWWTFQKWFLFLFFFQINLFSKKYLILFQFYNT